MDRPPGTVSIGQGRTDTGTVSPDEIPDRPHDGGEQEMLEDIFLLLKTRSTPRLDLVALFKSDSANQEGTREQRKRFGHNNADEGRKIIVQTIRDYAHATDNLYLLRLLDNFKNFSGNKADPRRRQKTPKPKPTLPADPIERDYQSIVTLVHRLGGRLNMPGGPLATALDRRKPVIRHRNIPIVWPTPWPAWSATGFCCKELAIMVRRSMCQGRTSKNTFPRPRERGIGFAHKSTCRRDFLGYTDRDTTLF